MHIGSNLNAPAQVLAARLQVLYNDQNNAKHTLMDQEKRLAKINAEIEGTNRAIKILNDASHQEKP